jgi:hypothetical protein
LIGDLVHRAAAQLLEPFGIGVDTAAEILGGWADPAKGAAHPPGPIRL